MNPTFSFLAYYSIMLLLGGVFICGWYAITRGEWVTLPNGVKDWKGKIFSSWLRFWEQEKSKPEKIYYSGEELIKLMAIIKTYIPTLIYQVLDKNRISIQLSHKEAFMSKVSSIENHLEITTTINECGGVYIIHFRKEYKCYRFPEWVRNPLASCIFCHASVYGSLVWWSAAFIFKNFLQLQISWLLLFIFWVPYMISLAFLSPFFYKFKKL